MSNKNLYQQPNVATVAPDAIIFIEGKRTIELKRVDDDGKINPVQVDFMRYVSSISTSKGIDKVPGEASIELKAPKHVMNGIFGNLKDALSTMLEVEIYMTGRFLVGDETLYYPTFWGIISNLSDTKTAGDLSTVSVTCVDMMRWLEMTKINIQVSVINAAIPINSDANAKQDVNPFGSIFVTLSTPGIIRAILTLTVNENFFEIKNAVDDRGKAIDKAVIVADDKKRISFMAYNDQIMNVWNQKFNALSSALYIYGFKSVNPNQIGFVNSQDEQGRQNELGIADVDINLNDYKFIYGSRPVLDVNTGLDVDLPWIDVSKLYPVGAGAFNLAEAPKFVSVFQNRMQIAKEATEQLHFEFYQDVDGTVVLKPQLYNLDTRKNPVYVLEDIDIQSINVIEDESQAITRIDVFGTLVNGLAGTEGDDINTRYGFAIDFSLMQKYGQREESISTNFITDSDTAYLYARNELARRNSLIINGSITIQGRPEIKLGYPVFIPSEESFYYVTGIDHNFSFGGTFETRLNVTAVRKIRRGPNGDPLQNLLVEVLGSPSIQDNTVGKDVTNNADNTMKNLIKLCELTSSTNAAAERPNFKYKTLDDILQYQGSFRFVQNQQPSTTDPRKAYSATDNDGYELLGSGFPYGKDLILTEDFRLISKATGDQATEIASSMTVTTSTGQQSTLSFQQPLTLDQIQNVEVVLKKSKSTIPATMMPSNAALNTLVSPSDIFSV
ncbi:MAG: hypothetical protein Q7R33_01955 [Nitrosarchaeum sp.]|nr:hypothetical protein [Nitrosarchaeum sp.]